MSGIKNMQWHVRDVPIEVYNIVEDENIEETIKSILSVAANRAFILYKGMFYGEIEKSDTVQSVMDFINSEKANFLSKTR